MNHAFIDLKHFSIKKKKKNQANAFGTSSTHSRRKCRKNQGPSICKQSVTIEKESGMALSQLKSLDTNYLTGVREKLNLLLDKKNANPEEITNFLDNLNTLFFDLKRKELESSVNVQVRFHKSCIHFTV
jgi:hypothetical protein